MGVSVFLRQKWRAITDYCDGSVPCGGRVLWYQAVVITSNYRTFVPDAICISAYLLVWAETR